MARLTGDTKKAKKIEDQHHNWELLVVKTVANIYANLPLLDAVTLLPYTLFKPKEGYRECWEVAYKASETISDTLHTDHCKIFVEGKRNQVFKDLNYQIPALGNFIFAYKNFKQGNSLKAFGYGILGTAEGAAMAAGI